MSRAKLTQSRMELNAGALTFIPGRAVASITAPKLPCSFFQRGRCTRTLCPFDHDVAVQDTRSNIICTFFIRDACTKGASCKFLHEKEHSSVEDHDKDLEPPNGGVLGLRNASSFTLPSHTLNGENPNSTIFGGATVTFGDGATVSTVFLPSDFSSIQLSNLPLDQTVQDIQGLLAEYGFPNIKHDAIRMHHSIQAKLQSVVIKIQDADFASTFLQRSGPNIKLGGLPVSVTKLHIGGTSDAGSNRLQLSSVQCTWYRPSRVAFLGYTNERHAKEAVAKIGACLRKLEGRKIEVISIRHQIVYLSQPSILLMIGNLDPRTTIKSLECFLPKPSPTTIKMGSSSHILTSPELLERIKVEMEKCGTLIDWVPTSSSTSSRNKVIVKFTDPEAARKAVKDLNGTSQDPRSTDKLSVLPIISIKLTVLRRILIAVEAEIAALAEKYRQDKDYVGVRTYESSEKETAHVRVYGQKKESVARVKGIVERILAGHVATRDDIPISDPYFFRSSSKEFIEKIMNEHDVCVHRDLRKTFIRLYGTSSNIKHVQDALIAQSSLLSVQKHVILLDAESLRDALKGAFRLLVKTIGKENVRMDITSTPKRIFVNGSESRLTQAQEILRNYGSKTLAEQMTNLDIGQRKEEELCPVCWTPPEEPTRTQCGHVYCASCLVSQCTSTSESDFPIRCLGNSATCSALLVNSELKQALPVSDYETMLQTSINGFIRGKPKEFRFCPTPDCDRFYRTTLRTSPRTFDCDGCLASICTGCHSEVHDGLSCDAHAALLKAATDGTEQFERWKKDNDVRDCPNCSAPIEKNSGCNHMECKSCAIHICWFCMVTFKTGPETYEHMRQSHE
ncbi:hypothetical protein B0J11DRAFT_541320 [Dendryphion nanum]|uniref:RING-type E3 ubiquitin transferase n=1 Tax=Dendryphion nanum TaxID=256645 RepID=A0A9P9D7G4_9PLEO|nr:hypothetical protein B0J11DRAFT_541320 [Dendryphion nanum]